MRKCSFCDKNIDHRHYNAKYCDDTCKEKHRYKRLGQRSTSKQRNQWYRQRLASDGYREKLQEQGRIRYYRVHDFLRSYKVEQGCADCGYNDHHAALEFDHIAGEKDLNVCNSKSIGQAKKEIQKCEVVCSNCHKIRTYERLQDKTYEEIK